MKKIYVLTFVVLLVAVSWSVYAYRQSGPKGTALPATQPISGTHKTPLHTQSWEHALVSSPQAKTKIAPDTVAFSAAAEGVKLESVLNIEAGIFTKPSDVELKVRLTPLQYQVTQEQGTEAPFQNLYWHNEQVGLYVDIVSGEPLFSSRDKYDSGTGWPSFTKPIKPAAVEERVDTLLGETRTEIVSAIAKSHLGHVFDDGPPPTGKRYCMNSAALRFIPVADLATEGDGGYKYLFQ